MSITVDPEFDSAEVLQQYAAGYQADPEHWKFLTGTREAIWQLSADGFGLPVRDDAQNAQMPILHDPRFIVVDRLGQVRGVFNSQSPEAIVELRKTLQFIVGEIAPPAEWSDEFSTAAETGVQQITHLIQPPEVADTEWLQRTKQTQLATTRRSFQFSATFSFKTVGQPAGSIFSRRLSTNRGGVYRSITTIMAMAYVSQMSTVTGVTISTLSARQALTRSGGIWVKGRFEDITEQSGVGVSERIGVTASFADIDNDGDADLYVTTVRGGNILFVNDGSGRFTDQTEASGLGFVGHSSASVFFDYDRDGLLDMFLCNVGQYTTDEFAPLRVDRTSSLAKGTKLSYYVGTKDAFCRSPEGRSDRTQSSVSQRR